MLIKSETGHLLCYQICVTLVLASNIESRIGSAVCLDEDCLTLRVAIRVFVGGIRTAESDLIIAVTVFVGIAEKVSAPVIASDPLGFKIEPTGPVAF